ncbi:MAG: TIGR02556 family CRISPR-associated protein, partial [Aquificota bacterium]
MLNAFKTIGELCGEIKLYDQVKADKVLVLEFDKNGNFQEAYWEDFFEDKQGKYLFRKGKGRNPPVLTPTIMLNKKDVSKTLNNIERILNNFDFKSVNRPNIRSAE